jgi:cell wall-associated NlpC family hydrolase
MPSNTDTGATPAAADATSTQSAAATAAGSSDAASTSATDEAGTTLGDAGKRALDAMKAERDTATRDAKAAKQALTELQNASLTEAERRDKRLAALELERSDWERERQDMQTREAVTVTALRLGYADPADAYSLINRSAIEFDDTGKPRNVDKLLTDLIAAKPYLAGASRPGGSFDGGPRGVPASGTNMNDMLRRAAGRTS